MAERVRPRTTDEFLRLMEEFLMRVRITVRPLHVRDVQEAINVIVHEHRAWKRERAEWIKHLPPGTVFNLDRNDEEGQ
jgi:hypothetical protein